MSIDRGAAVSDVDPFSDEFLNEPYPFHERLREAGAVVWLERYGIWASARHAEVQAARTDWEAFSSAAGVGIDDFRKAKPWRPPSSHSRGRPSPAYAQPHGPQPRALGQGDGGVSRGVQGRRGAPVRYACRAPPRRRHREALSPDGMGATIWAAVDSGEVTAQEAPFLVRSLLSAGLDTTIIGIGNGLYAFAANPGQWQALRDNPALVRPAFDEILRWESPVQTFFRTTTKQVELGGMTLPADAKILLFLAGANRDPRRWEQPDRFDIGRRAAGHVAFGAGIHLCVGQMLARTRIRDGSCGPVAARRAH